VWVKPVHYLTLLSNQIPNLKKKTTTPILAFYTPPPSTLPPFHPPQPTNINLDYTIHRKNIGETQQATKADAAA
jgi:hypothetical protein